MTTNTLNPHPAMATIAERLAAVLEAMQVHTAAYDPAPGTDPYHHWAKQLLAGPHCDHPVVVVAILNDNRTFAWVTELTACFAPNRDADAVLMRFARHNDARPQNPPEFELVLNQSFV